MKKKLTYYQKFINKINNLKSKNEEVIIENNICKFKGKIIFSFTEEFIEYSNNRISLTSKEEIYEKEYRVKVYLNDISLSVLNSNISKVPSGIKNIEKAFSNFSENKNIENIIIGGNLDKFENGNLELTITTYENINSIFKEENSDRDDRFFSRVKPIFNNSLNMNFSRKVIKDRDYKLLLQEVLSSKRLDSEDLYNIASDVSHGKLTKLVIKEEIKKEAMWFLNNFKTVIDTDLNTTKAKGFGVMFGYAKKSIKGPEHLLETILSDFGQNIIFGSPYVLETDKYAISSDPSFSRCQFDLILVNNSLDIEIVELKRSDTYILDFDSHRNKFYPSKELAVAIGQAERYITLMYKGNDQEVKISGMKIIDYIKKETGKDVEIVRPSATIIIGRQDLLYKKYKDLNSKEKNKISKSDYEKDGKRVYKELKNSMKNIKIVSYSELIEVAELRLI
jgi:hypothetical protein